jgi:peptide-methionine (R)-S-oxide reductase
MQRRTILAALGALAALPLGLAARRVAAARPQNMAEVRALETGWRSLLAPGTPVPDPGDKVSLSKDAWQKRLSREQFDVLRREGTERAFTSPLDKEKRAGVFACAGCGLPLFTSAMKFDSGTGWPSFFTAIPGALGTKRDRSIFLMTRTEYHCIRCDGHQGHVFDDGPPPTGLRYCNNGVALSFIPKG